MADENATPPLPPTSEIVTGAPLYLNQVLSWQRSLAFGGTQNPSSVWTQMVRNEPFAMLYYRELEEKDDDVGNALDTLKEKALERAWSIEPFDTQDTKAVEVADFIKAQLKNIANLDAVLDCMLDAPGYGFSVQEMIFDVSAGQAELADIRDCPQELFLFGNRYQPQVGQLQFLASPWASEGTLVPEEKFLIYSHRGRSRNRMGRPLLRAVFWQSWIKRQAQRLWMRYAEKGPGTAVVRYQDANNEQQKQQAADLAQALVDSVAVGVPLGFEYDKELLTSTRPINPDVYLKLFEASQKAVVRRVMGETLTSFGGDGGKGTQALGDVHQDTLETKSIRLCKALASVLDRQLIRPLVLWNFGPDVPMPCWKFDIEEKEDLTARINIDDKAQSMGTAITAGYMQKRYGIPAPEAGDQILTPAASPATPLPMDKADFSEQEQAEKDLDQFDQLMDQLRDKSLGIFEQRTREIASAVPAPGK